jgi:dienelactone hydrolase
MQPCVSFIVASTLAGGLLLVACGSSGGGGGGDVNLGDGGTASSSSGSNHDGGTVEADGGSGFEYDSGSAGDSASSSDGPASAGDSGQGTSGDGAATGSIGPYGSAGPATVTTTSFSVTSPNTTFTTDAYIPSGAGPFPVVILSSGFFQTAAGYAPYAERLASWGVVTFLRDDPNLAEGTPAVVSDVEYTVDTWLSTTNSDSSSALYKKLDLTRVGLAGHSRGGQIALLAGEGLKGKILGIFGLDPVDQSTGSDPEARTTLATVGVPLAFIGETTDSAASSCAPAADNYEVLYAAASSPAVAMTAIDADHTMFEDAANCTLCTVCTAGTAKQTLVLATAVRYLTAFFARELLGDATVGAAFQGAGANQDVAAGIITIESK